MIPSSLISKTIPSLFLQDKAGKALLLMDDFEVNHLCVVQKDNFLGVVSKDDVLSLDESTVIEALQEDFIHVLVFENEHFSKALRLMAEHKLSVIPVLNAEREYAGVVNEKAMINHLAHFTGSEEPGGIIVLEMDRRDYSFSELSRLVETNDAIITQLNTFTDPASGLMNVTIRINKTEIADIIATLQRYEYNVVSYHGDEAYANELKENYNHLLHYLNL
jgi:acetoin utilization protein AcuB